MTFPEVHEMEPVCLDGGGSKARWYHKDGVYYRLSGIGKPAGKIRGTSLPDPHLLYEKYKQIHPEARKPTDATYALWQHWQNRQAANGVA